MDKKYEDAIPYAYQFKNPDSQMGQLSMDLQGEDQIMSSDETRISEDLKEAYAKSMKGLETFLSREYASFQNKVFKCMFNRCYNDIFMERQPITQCKKECSNSIERVQDFTERQFNRVHDKFNQCMQESQKKSFTLENTFKCHDELYEALENIKLSVRQEFNYYQ